MGISKANHRWCSIPPPAQSAPGNRGFGFNNEQRKAWLERAVSKSLAMMREALGPNEYLRFLQRLKHLGEEKFSNLDLLVVEEYRRIAA